MDSDTDTDSIPQPPPHTDLDSVVAEMLHHRSHQAAPGDPVRPPLVPASMYHLPGEPAGPFQYGRWTNPTWQATEEALGHLEAADVVTFPSGMAAIGAVLCSLVRSGGRILLPSDGYYTTRLLATTYLEPNGVTVETCSTPAMADHDLDGFDLVFVETPSNPTLDLCDLDRLVANASAAGALVVADNTTMTPLGQRPLDHGVDIVVSSDTKAVNGHSDVLFGHVASRRPEMIEQVTNWRTIVGAIPGHFESWLVHRGLETLELRFSRMCRSAGVLADRLAQHPAVVHVSYPGLASHRQHELAVRQMIRFGTLIGIEFTTEEQADRFAEEAKLVIPATSFGGTHTTADRRARWGDQVAPGFVRLSVGCEPTEALWTDISQVLDRL